MAIEVFLFFSGLGFLDLGFEEAGFDIAFVNEYNHGFMQAYQYARRNIFCDKRFSDSRNLPRASVRSIRAIRSSINSCFRVCTAK